MFQYHLALWVATSKSETITHLVSGSHIIQMKNLINTARSVIHAFDDTNFTSVMELVILSMVFVVTVLAIAPIV